MMNCTAHIYTWCDVRLIYFSDLENIYSKGRNIWINEITYIFYLYIWYGLLRRAQTERTEK